MGFWIILLLAVFIIVVLSLIYLVRKISVLFSDKTYKLKQMPLLIGFFVVFITGLICFFAMGVVNMNIIFIHLVAICLIMDLIFFAAKKCTGKTTDKRIRFVFSILLTVIYLGTGWYNAHHVDRTVYDIKTDKDLGAEGVRVAAFADSHMGTTFGFKGFSEHLNEIAGDNPDVLVIAGDFVDDDSTKEDMEKACEALGRIKPKYGKYFVFGNHDKGYYGSEHRGFGADELVFNLEKNDVKVLQDDFVCVTGNVYLLGRQDKENVNRAKMDELMAQRRPEDYVIVLDHQPADYENESAQGADMVISGHTHGGQIFPFNKMGEWLHMNDMTYGHDKRRETDFLVTSGISDWALKFKTGCKSEYLLVNVKK